MSNDTEDDDLALRFALQRAPLTPNKRLADLYARAEQLSAAPVDYSQVEQFARERAAGSQRDFLGGLALATLGGEQMSPIGRALATSAIEEGKPFRGNQADTGYFLPESGKFAENPSAVLARKLRELNLQSAAAEREETLRANIADRQQRAQEANELRRDLAASRPAPSEPLYQTTDEQGNVVWTPRSLAANKPVAPKGGAQTKIDPSVMESWLDEAEKLLPQSTHSYIGTGVDALGRVVGIPTQGSQAIAGLKTIEGNLVQNAPRLPGPVSDADLKFIRDAQGRLSDPTTPVEDRQAALNQLRAIVRKSAGKGAPPGQTAAGKIKPAAPQAGAVVKGYRFKGGDPSKRENWEPQ